MARVDLITGFLGSGKTTFIHKYANYLINNNEKIAIIVNDFGAVNVDRLLFSDLEIKGVHIEQVACGKISCDWKRRFRTKLITLSLYHFSHVIVEPSGIFNMDDFLDVMNDDTIVNLFSIGSVIAISDMPKFHNKYEEYLFVNDISSAGIIFISKLDKNNPNDVKECIYKSLDSFHTDKDYLNIPIIDYSWDEFDFSRLNSIGYNDLYHDRLSCDYNSIFNSFYILNSNIKKDELLKRIKFLFEDKSLGVIIRIKGFIFDDEWYEINATHDETTISKRMNAQRAIIIIGTNLNEERIKELLS